MNYYVSHNDFIIHFFLQPATKDFDVDIDQADTIVRTSVVVLTCYGILNLVFLPILVKQVKGLKKLLFILQQIFAMAYLIMIAVAYGIVAESFMSLDTFTLIRSIDKFKIHQIDLKSTMLWAAWKSVVKIAF